MRGHWHTVPRGCPVGATNHVPMNFNFTTKATTFGFVGGVDRTYRNFGDGGGTLIAGILTGYLSSDMKSSVTSTPATAAAAAQVGTGFSTLSGHLTGPSLGAYATYFRNGFSTDLTLKVDFLHLNETFTDIPFIQCKGPPPPPANPGIDGLSDRIAQHPLQSRVPDQPI